MEVLDILLGAVLGGLATLGINLYLVRHRDRREFVKEGAKELLRAVIDAQRTVGMRGSGRPRFNFERWQEASDRFDEVWNSWQDRLLDHPKAMANVEAVGALLSVAAAIDFDHAVHFESLYFDASYKAERVLQALLRGERVPDLDVLDGWAMKQLILDDPSFGKLRDRVQEEGLDVPV